MSSFECIPARPGTHCPPPRTGPPARSILQRILVRGEREPFAPLLDYDLPPSAVRPPLLPWVRSQHPNQAMVGHVEVMMESVSHTIMVSGLTLAACFLSLAFFPVSCARQPAPTRATALSCIASLTLHSIFCSSAASPSRRLVVAPPLCGTHARRVRLSVLNLCLRPPAHPPPKSPPVLYSLATASHAVTSASLGYRPP